MVYVELKVPPSLLAQLPRNNGRIASESRLYDLGFMCYRCVRVGEVTQFVLRHGSHPNRPVRTWCMRAEHTQERQTHQRQHEWWSQRKVRHTHPDPATHPLSLTLAQTRRHRMAASPHLLLASGTARFPLSQQGATASRPLSGGCGPLSLPSLPSWFWLAELPCPCRVAVCVRATPKMPLVRTAKSNPRHRNGGLVQSLDTPARVCPTKHQPASTMTRKDGCHTAPHHDAAVATLE